MGLDIAEFFVTLIFENFSEKGDFMIDVNVFLDSINYGGGPFDDKRFQTVFVV
jgi:hypothetical protein